MKRVRAKIWFALASVAAIGLALVWAEVHRPKPCAGEWIRLSTPTVGSRTNSGVATPVLAFRVSNVGPRSVDFQVFWFESRAKRDGFLLATNRLKSVTTPLAPGKSASLTIDVSLMAAPVEDCLCCYQVNWLQREPPVRRDADWFGRWWFDLFDANWHPPWGSKHLMHGTAFAANLEVVDYFRRMYGFTRTQWLEDLARMQSARTQTTGPGRYAMAWAPTADETVTNDAREAFIDFCQASTSSARDAELIAPPNAAPPHR